MNYRAGLTSSQFWFKGLTLLKASYYVLSFLSTLLGVVLSNMWKHPGVRVAAAISLGAVAGALCRYYLGIWFAQLLGSTFPYGTMFINVTGCFVMGFFVTFALARVIPIHPELHLMVTTGFLGSYTTFSSYELDTARLVNQSLESGLIYWSGSILLGVISLQLGMMLAKVMSRPSL